VFVGYPRLMPKVPQSSDSETDFPMQLFLVVNVIKGKYLSLQEICREQEKNVRKGEIQGRGDPK
jgi:hypothetical protein